MESQSSFDVSVILPVHNAGLWLAECLHSILLQVQGSLKIEVSIYNDGSSDDSIVIINDWKPVLEAEGLKVKIGSHIGSPRGVGYAKNQSIQQSSGKYLCFQDSDDIMRPERIKLQYQAALTHPTAIVGSKFERDPPDSTARYTQWANSLTPTQLNVQVLTSHGPTVIMPTWFCSRDTFDRVGGFDESGKGTPEDLIFFYRHLDLGGTVHRVDELLLVYRYHPTQTTFSIDDLNVRKDIWNLRLKRLQKNYLDRWERFTIWNAGKQGRRLYRTLDESYRLKVDAFCDVDVKKIEQGTYIYEESAQRPKPRVPIVHFSKAKPPFVICVKLDLTKGEFENNLKSLSLKEDVDYVIFS